MITEWETNLLAAMDKLPSPGGMIDVRSDGSKIVAIYWGWAGQTNDGKKQKYRGWFDAKGNPIKNPDEVMDAIPIVK